MCYTIGKMKVLVLYRPNSEYGRRVEEFIHEFTQRDNPKRLEILDIDSREGSATATLYDIVRHPAILVLQTDGQLQRCWMWEDSGFPQVDEVVSYVRA